MQRSKKRFLRHLLNKTRKENKGRGLSLRGLFSFVDDDDEGTCNFASEKVSTKRIFVAEVLWLFNLDDV